MYDRTTSFLARMGRMGIGLSVLVSTAAPSALRAPAIKEVPLPPANVMFLLNNSETMQDFPRYLPNDFTPGFYPSPNSNKGTRGYVGAWRGTSSTRAARIPRWWRR